VLRHVGGVINAVAYKNILSRHMIPDAKRMFPEGSYVFQHDNAPVHTAASVKKWVQTKGLDVMIWPPQSPDLNPIENLWYILDLALKNRHPHSRLDLVNTLKIGWSEISAKKREALVGSMKKRCELVIESQGYPIKY